TPAWYVRSLPAALPILLRRCRQRLTRRPSSEHARTTERLQPGGKALRRARRKLVDENGHRAGIRPYRPSVARRPARIDDELEFEIAHPQVADRYGFVDQVPGDAANHLGQPARIAAQVDDEPVSIAKGVDGLRKRLGNGR